MNKLQLNLYLSSGLVFTHNLPQIIKYTTEQYLGYPSSKNILDNDPKIFYDSWVKYLQNF